MKRQRKGFAINLKNQTAVSSALLEMELWGNGFMLTKRTEIFCIVKPVARSFLFLNLLMKNSYPIVYVEWEDACSAPDKWVAESELGDWIEKGASLVKQVGFLLEKNKDFIVLCAMRADESEYNQAVFGHVHKIPSSLCKLTYLQEVNPEEALISYEKWCDLPSPQDHD